MPAGKDKLFPWFLRRALGEVSAFLCIRLIGCAADVPLIPLLALTGMLPLRLSTGVSDKSYFPVNFK